MNKEYDVLVLGAGPGGYVAAIKAAQAGLKTVIVEKEHLGGVCLNWGCIPTKALLRTAEISNIIKHAEEFGIKCKDVEIDFQKVIQRSRDTAKKLSKGINSLLVKNQVEIVYGHGKFVNNNTLEITNKSGASQIKAKNIIIATGAKPKFIPKLSPKDSPIIMGYKEALLPTKLPKELLIIGSGAIGVEFASFYSSMGSKVTILEISNRILANEDVEVSKFVSDSFIKRGISILTSSEINSFNIHDTEVAFDIKHNGKIITKKFAGVISAIGVQANIDQIGLEKAGVETEKQGYVKTNGFMQTSTPGIYAIGDITAPPWLAHKASKEADICIEKILGNSNIAEIDRNKIPACTFCNPQIASIGLTEEEAVLQYSKNDLKIGKFPLMGNGKAIAVGEPDGFIKTIFHKNTGQLLGAHMVGVEVTEMIFGISLAMELETTEKELLSAIFPHPTISESIQESVLSAIGKGLHF